MDRLFDKVSQRIHIYIGRETQDDPYEKNVTVSLLNPIPISAIVSEIDFTKIQWIMPGIVTDKVIQIIIKKRHLNLLKKSQKIKVSDEFYVGYRNNGRLQFKREADFIRAYLYIKKA